MGSHRIRVVVTAVWLVLLLAAGATRVRGTWPVGRATMFAFAADQHTAVVVRATADGTGRPVVLAAGEFGLTTGQLRNWLATTIGATVEPADEGVLDVLERVWNEAHPAAPVGSVEVWTATAPLPGRIGETVVRRVLPVEGR